MGTDTATTWRRSRGWLIAGGALLIGLVALGITLLRPGGRDPSPGAATATGDGGATAASADRPDAPDLEFARRDGGTIALATFEGQPLVLNFWASWCPPCVAEMGSLLEPAHQRYGHEVAFLGVNLQDEPAAAQRIIDQTGITYELAVDENGAAFAAFSGVGMPTTVFIDAQGRIADRHTGILTADQLEAQIARLTEA